MDNLNVSNTLIDNSEGLKLIDFLKCLLEKDLTEVCIATGYWDIPGISLLCEALEKFLEKENTSLRIVIGSDPYLFAKYNAKPKYKGLKFPEDYIKTDINEIEVVPAYEHAIQFLLNYLSHDKIKIKLYKKNLNAQTEFLHAKAYIFKGENNSYGIIGSSNFTQKGLEGNAELNYLETNSMIVTAEPKFGSASKGHIFWFEQMWENSIDWTQEFLEQVLKPSRIAQSVLKKNPEPFTVLSPYETYIKLLIENFSEVIDTDGKINPDDYMPRDVGFKRLSYQSEAVNAGYAIMKRHGGFILADVVGLGKTFTALMTVKRHLLETDFQKPVLIITPPAVKQNWIDSIRYFDKDEIRDRHLEPMIHITTIGLLEDTDELLDDFDDSFVPDNYCIIIVDESHKFRNSNTLMYKKLDALIGNGNVQPYIILISATPQNNKPTDLKNQICLFQREAENSTLQNLGNHGNNLIRYFAEKEKNYNNYIKKTKTINGKKCSKSAEELKADKQNLIADSEDIRKKIIEPLVIRRTRSDIEKYYKEDMQEQGLHFPKIKEPFAIPYEMKGELGELFNDTINIIAPRINHIDSDDKGQSLLDFGSIAGDNALGFYRYRAIEYLIETENKKRYETRSTTTVAIAQRLAGLMELFLVKRLESSQAAFKESLHNLKRYTENMIKMWEADRIFICPDLDVNNELKDTSIKNYKNFTQCLDILSQKAKNQNRKYSGDENIGPNQEYTGNDFKKEYIVLLKNDLRLIELLCESWDKQTNDPKMETFLRKIDSVFFNKKQNPFGKLIVFTECIATQEALVQKLENCASEFKVLSITASNRDEKAKLIAENFDANIPKAEQKNDYHILITTDVLAEGVNLHRANSILNYDSPWNATRLMQRLGRINRIGTTAKEIWNYNFYPSTLGDEQINLKKRTLVKLQAFHELFGEDSKIFSVQEEVKHFDKIERADLFEESESPLMPFIAELRNFRNKNTQAYKRLSEIQTLCVAAVKNNTSIAFSNLKEKKTDGTFLSKLYICENKKTMQQSQLEFFERLKEFIRCKDKTVSPENVKSDKINSTVKKILQQYRQDCQTEKVPLRSKKDKNKNDAIKKLQQLLSKINSKEMQDKINALADSIRAGNASLSKKILASDFDAILFENTEQMIDRYHEGIHKTIRNKTVAITSMILTTGENE